MRLKPDEAKARNNLAIALWQSGERLAAQGKWVEAIGQYERSVALKPDNAPAHDSWGLALSRLGRYGPAVVEYEQALAVDPGLPSARNNLAWTLATCGDAAVRNGARAVALAEAANQAAGGKDAAILDTLAAAYAEAGRFADAVRTAQAALELVKGAGQAEPARQIQERLQLYQSGRPYHEESSLGR